MIEEHRAGNKLAGVYRGKVLQHMTHGYCKIMIHGVYPAEWEQHPDMLPKAEQASPLFAGSFDGNGTFSYPNIGATVWCMFANGDQNLPIYFASSLGGSNAFGQHDIILDRKTFVVEAEDNRGNSKKVSVDVQISDKHLITAGKTHVEMFENGKLSSIVQTPDTRPAKVEYNFTEDGYLSADSVTERPVYEQIENEEVSTINCQHVLDVNSSEGEISASTHCFVPYSEASVIILSAEQRTIMSSYSEDTQADTLRKHNDLGLIEDSILSSRSQDFKFTDIDMLKKYNATTLSSMQADSDNIIEKSIEGKTHFQQEDSYEDNFTSSYIKLDENNNPEVIILSNATNEDLRCNIEVRDNRGTLSNIVDRDDEFSEIYTYNSTKEAISDSRKIDISNKRHNEIANDGDVGKNESDDSHKISKILAKVSPEEQFIDNYSEKGNSQANVSFKKNDNVDASMLSAVKIEQTTIYPLIDKIRIYKEKMSNQTGLSVGYDNDNQVFQLSSFENDDLQITGGITHEVGLTSINNNTLQQQITGTTLSSYRYEKQKVDSAERILLDNDSSLKLATSEDQTGVFLASDNRKSKISFVGTVDTQTGEVELKITDKKSGNYSKVILDTRGNATVNASKTITLKAPNIEVVGVTHITGKTTIDSQTLIKSSLITNGDATINGSSYTKHVHKYTVPAHPAGQAPTTTRTS